MKEDARLGYTSWTGEKSATRGNPQPVHMAIVNQNGSQIDVQQTFLCHSNEHKNFLQDGVLLTYYNTAAVSDPL